MAIKFVTDSMMDPSDGLAEEYDYDVIPIPISYDGKTYYDGVDISPEMVVEFGKSGHEMPKTSQIPVATYKEAFEKHLKNGDDIVYVGLSGNLSGTLQAAMMAAEELKEDYPERVVKIIDSKSATLAQTMLFHQALKLGKLGKSIDEIEEIVNYLADHLNIFFVVEDLNWLSKGGRISKSAAALGNLLNVNPILWFNDGKIEVFDKVRGKRKAVKRLETMMKKAIEDNPDQIVGICESNNPDIAEKLEKIAKKSKHTNVLKPKRGPGAALTTHTGQGLYGFGYFEDVPDEYVNVYP